MHLFIYHISIYLSICLSIYLCIYLYTHKHIYIASPIFFFGGTVARHGISPGATSIPGLAAGSTGAGAGSGAGCSGSGGAGAAETSLSWMNKPHRMVPQLNHVKPG